MRNIKTTLLIAIMCITAINCVAQKDENFKTFWKSYTTDSIFQMERTKFPLSLTYFEYDDENETETEITENIDAEFWRFDNFADESYKAKIEKEDNAYTVTKAGIENGISVTYTFVCIENKWHLIKITDSSN